MHALRPEPLQTARLSEALADVADRWSELHGIPVQVTTTGTARPMRPEAEFALLRTAQEALANVAKHAQREPGRGDAVVHGAGGRPGRARRRRRLRPGRGQVERDGGFGLVAMRQRVEGLSGTLQVESEPGGGTGDLGLRPVRVTRGACA